MPSVLQMWVQELSLREQGTLIVATRGCDAAPKHPLDSPERRLTAAIRCYVLVPADPREVDSALGCFMSKKIPLDFKISALEHYPCHWVLHAMHAAEVMGYKYSHWPSEASNMEIRERWLDLYKKFCHALHVNPETRQQFENRMNEDRIATNSVVS